MSTSPTSIHWHKENLFQFLWYERRVRVLIGYHPDVRLCGTLVETRKVYWNSAHGTITFENGMVMSINDKTIRGDKVYLFDAWALRAFWRGRRPELELLPILETLSDATVEACVWHIERSAGEVSPPWHRGRQTLLARAAELLPNMSVPDKESLLRLVEAETRVIAPVAA